MRGWIFAVILGGVGVLVVLAFWGRLSPTVPRSDGLPTTVPGSASPTVASPTTSVTAGPKVSTFEQFLDALDPAVAAAEVSRTPLPLEAAASVVTLYTVHLDRRGDLWLTHPNGPSLEQVLSEPIPSDQTAHVTSAEVLMVHWDRDGRGRWVPQVVARSGGTLQQWHSASGAVSLGRTDYYWSRAVRDAGGRYVVPTDGGVAVFTLTPSGVSEAHADLATGRTPVLAVATGQAVFAFRPWENGRVGSEAVLVLEAGAAEFTPLPDDAGFPPYLIHLFPLTDGALLALAAADDGGMSITTVLPPVEEDDARDQRIRDLVEQLNDPARGKRNEAQAELARFGPTAWAILEAELGRHTPEAETILRKLLGLRAKPALGIFEVYPGPVRLLARGQDGSIALAAYGGVGWYDAGEDQFRSPAVLIARPNLRAQLAHPSILHDRPIESLRMTLLPGDVLIDDADRGVLRFMGNHLAPLLPANQSAFRDWVGVDRSRRWVFRDPATQRTLLIDTQRLTPVPRLPAWNIRLSEGHTGWDDGDHPVIERDGSAWRLEQGGWRPLDEGARWHRMSVGLADMLVQGIRPELHARQDAAAKGPPLAAVQVSSTRTFVIRSGEVTRFSRPDAAAPWTQDATFTEQMPTQGIRRVWLDPFGRICIAHGTGELTLLFPSGVIPRELAALVRSRSPERP